MKLNWVLSLKQFDSNQQFCMFSSSFSISFLSPVQYWSGSSEFWLSPGSCLVIHVRQTLSSFCLDTMTLQRCIFNTSFSYQICTLYPPCKPETTFFPLERLLTVLCAQELRSPVAMLWHSRLVVTQGLVSHVVILANTGISDVCRTFIFSMVLQRRARIIAFYLKQTKPN